MHKLKHTLLILNLATGNYETAGAFDSSQACVSALVDVLNEGGTARCRLTYANGQPVPLAFEDAPEFIIPKPLDIDPRWFKNPRGDRHGDRGHGRRRRSR